MDPHHQVDLSRCLSYEPHGYNMYTFVKMWIDGVDILALDPTPKKLIEYTNPFTGQKEVREVRAPRKPQGK
jgi:hypothetical protein